MIGLIRYFLGIIPKTSDIEEKEAALIKELNDLKDYIESEELKRFEELKKIVPSQAFKARRKEIESQNFKNTKEYKELQRLLALKKSPKVKNYYKVLESHEYAEYKTIKESGEYKDVASLDEETLKSNRYKVYSKFENSPSFKMFVDFVESGELKQYEEIEAYTQSEEFVKVKTYMELPAKEKWALSDESKQLEEYNTLSNSEKIKWYYKVKDSKKFDDLKAWNNTFDEDFTAKLDASKWLNRYFWGDAMLNASYSLTSDLHYITEGKNLEVSDSILKINTRKETASGMSWDPERGFFPREFNYTSGLINTGKSFRQQEGRFKAKIKINSGQAASHAFSLMSNMMVPQVDILKYDSGKLMMNFFGGSIQNIIKSVKKLSASKIENDYFIFELEWTAQSMVWKVNGLELRKQQVSLPSEPMYIYLGSALYNEPSTTILPSVMEIDWVRCYQKA